MSNETDKMQTAAEDLDLLDSILKGYPLSMARVDAMYAVNRLRLSVARQADPGRARPVAAAEDFDEKRKRLGNALIAAALDMCDLTSCHSFSIPIPNTTPQLRVSLHEGEVLGSNAPEVLASPAAQAQPVAWMFTTASGAGGLSFEQGCGTDTPLYTRPAPEALAPDAEVARLVAALRNMKANDFPPSAPWTRGDCKIVAEAADLIERIAAHPVAGEAGTPVAVVIQGTEVDLDGKPTSARELDWYDRDIADLPVGTKLYALAAPPAKAEREVLTDEEALYVALHHADVGDKLERGQKLRAVGDPTYYGFTRAALLRFVQAIAATPARPSEAREPLSDEQIEDALRKAGGRWNGDHWVIEDADLHPFVRGIGIPARVDSEGA